MQQIQLCKITTSVKVMIKCEDATQLRLLIKDDILKLLVKNPTTLTTTQLISALLKETPSISFTHKNEKICSLQNGIA